MDTQLRIMTKSVMAALLVAAGSANAQSSPGPVTVSDNFTLGANQMSWTTSGGACLTAGGATLPSNVTAASTVIPTCSTSGQLGGYANATYPNGAMASGAKDPGGYGALRLTNAVGSAAGSIVWNSTFPSSAGISITFTAVSYDGNSYGGADGGHNGADGLSFFLMDAGVSPHTIGQYGGSLGYSCAQGKGGGAAGGYIGLGIDEYGNFLNSGDNTATGVTNTTNSGAGQFQGNRIGVRGAGVVNWMQLHSLYPSFYPSSLTSSQQSTAVQKTCSTGYLWDYSGSSAVQACNNFSQLNSAFPSYYPSTLTSSQRTAATSNTCSTGVLWDYSGSSPTQACSTFAQLNSAYPTYYPSTLNSTQQASAVSNTCSTQYVWDYSGSNSSPDYSTNSSPYEIGACYSYSQLQSINSSYYPSGLTASQQNSAVNNTCSSGYYYRYRSSYGTFSQTSTAVSLPNSISWSNPAPPVPVMDYAVVQYTNSLGVTVPARSVLNVPIANESAGPRNAYGSYAGATAYTYNLSITSNGLLSLSYTNNANSATGTTTVATNWPIFSSNGTAPANFTFGFAASTGGGTNVHEITCFQAAPTEDTDSSAAVNAVEAGQVKTTTAVYLAFYHTHDWWGQLTSTPLVLNAAQTQLSIGSTSNWDSSCVLTGDTTGTTLPGNNCAATGSTADAAAPVPSSRVMLSYDPVGQTGEAFETTGTGALTAAQQSTLGAGDSLATQRVQYLRGDRTNEINASTGVGLFRARISVLGDIVNSSPTWLGGPGEFYPSGAWTDLLYPSTPMPESAATFGAFQTAQANRLNVVYVGANDGFLHGFEAGVYNSSTGNVTTPGAGTINDGKEVIAYMPSTVLQSIHNNTNTTLDYSSPVYGHNYSVDGTPGVGSLFYGGAWHTWLVGGLGAGGSAIYALDVTNPSNFSEANAATIVKGEWTPSSSALGAAATNMGNTYGIPKIMRFHTGKWGFIFGNGYNSGGTAGVFVGQVDQTTGAVTFTFLAVPSSGGANNAVFNATAVDLDGDGIADYIYAGDLNGNLWRWDVTPNGTWSSTPILIFQTPNGQPISTQVEVVAAPTATGSQRLMLDFGTGIQLPNGSNPNSNTYATGQQALYGVWDGNMTAWNSLPNVALTNNYDAFPAVVSGTPLTQPYTVSASNLLTQSTTASGSYVASSGTVNYRSISSGSPCWADGPSTCSTYGSIGQYGWTYALPGTANNNAPEQVVFSPAISQGVFVVNTYIAQAQQQCTTNNPTGWTISIDATTGASLPQSYFINNQGVNESAVQTGATGSPTFVATPTGTYLVTNTSTTTGTGASQHQGLVTPVSGGNNVGARLNWIQLR